MYEYFEDEVNIYLILEKWDGGELFDKIIEREFFSEKEAAVVFKQILQAINYCHNMGVWHRDLKPENFIYATKDSDSDIKIIDFGLSKIFDPTTSGYTLMKTGCGTPYYNQIKLWTLSWKYRISSTFTGFSMTDYPILDNLQNTRLKSDSEISYLFFDLLLKLK